MNPWILLGIALAWGGSLAGAGLWGYGAGQDAVIAKQAKEDDVRRQTLELAQKGAADAIARIEIKHTTVQSQFQREVVNHVVYRDCMHTADGLRLVQEALTGQPYTATEGVVRPADAAAGPVIRLDQQQADRSVAPVSKVPRVARNPQ